MSACSPTADNFTEAEIVKLMVGRNWQPSIPRRYRPTQETILTVSDFSVPETRCTIFR